MKKVYGISLSLSSFERGLWFDHDQKRYYPEGWGVKLSLVGGKMIRPIPKFWKPGFWRGEAQYNPWKGGEYLMILRIPFVLGLFFSVALGPLGFYFGFKTFEITEKHLEVERYGKWLKPGEAGTTEDPGVYLQISASTRTTRWK